MNDPNRRGRVSDAYVRLVRGTEGIRMFSKRLQFQWPQTFVQNHLECAFCLVTTGAHGYPHCKR